MAIVKVIFSVFIGFLLGVTVKKITDKQEGEKK